MSASPSQNQSIGLGSDWEIIQLRQRTMFVTAVPRGEQPIPHPRTLQLPGYPRTQPAQQ